jgi:hypothetical protein
MPLKLPEELKDIYAKVFNELKEKEFLYRLIRLTPPPTILGWGQC